MSVDVYDYLDMEWFTNAQRLGRRTVFGPYVDYTGADHYVLTLTIPVVDDRFLGVVGVDIRMSAYEPELLAILKQIPGEAVLVNAERRVIVANSPRWVVGSKVPAMP